MGRAGYSDDGDNIAMWRGQVMSAIRGKRGQAFLRELVAALDALPEKRLIADRLIVAPADTYGPPTRTEYYRDGGQPPEPGVCAIGTVGLKRDIDMSALDPQDYDSIAGAFGIAHQLVREIEYMNDEAAWGVDTPETRWSRVRNWAASQLKDSAP